HDIRVSSVNIVDMPPRSELYYHRFSCSNVAPHSSIFDRFGLSGTRLVALLSLFLLADAMASTRRRALPAPRRPAPRSVKTSAMERLFVLLVAALAFGCSDAERQGGEAWHHARDFVKVEPGTLISRTCGKDGEKDDSFKVQYVNCVFIDNLINAEGDMVSTASIRMPYNGGFSLTYAGTTPGIKAATTWGPGMTAMRTHGIYCRGDSHASTPHCLVELVHLERSEVTWSEASRIDENSSLTLRMSCPEWLVGDHGDHTSETRQTPTHLEFHATGCDVIRYPETREAPQE